MQALTGPAMFHFRHNALSYPPFLAWVCAGSMLAGMCVVAATRLGPTPVVLGMPIVLACGGIAAMLWIRRTRMLGIEVTRDGIVWRVRYGPEHRVFWAEVRRMVRHSRWGRSDAFQFVTGRGSFVLAMRDFEDGKRLAATLMTHAVFLEVRAGARAARSDEDDPEPRATRRGPPRRAPATVAAPIAARQPRPPTDLGRGYAR